MLLSNVSLHRYKYKTRSLPYISHNFGKGEKEAVTVKVVVMEKEAIVAI